MDAQTEAPADPGVAGLFHQLVDDGKGLVRAEVNLYKQIALYRASKAKYGIAALVAAPVLVLAGLVAMLVGFVIGLARSVGPVGAGIIVFAATGAIGYLLVRFATVKLAALAGDEGEREALAEGERRA